MSIERLGLRPNPYAPPAAAGPGPAERALPSAAPTPAPAAGAAGGATGPTFADMLDQVVKADQTAQQQTAAYARGEHNNLHETMLALEKADIHFSLLVSVRNKLLEAYREVMRMS